MVPDHVCVQESPLVVIVERQLRVDCGCHVVEPLRIMPPGPVPDLQRSSSQRCQTASQLAKAKLSCASCSPQRHVAKSIRDLENDDRRSYGRPWMAGGRDREPINLLEDLDALHLYTRAGLRHRTYDGSSFRFITPNLELMNLCRNAVTK